MRIRNLSCALIASIILFSCTKAVDPIPEIPPPPVPSFPLSGLWLGTYTVDGAGPATYPYTFAFHPDGRVVASGVGDNGHLYVSIGTYATVDSVVTADYITINYDRGYQVSQRAILTHHTDGTITDATWTDVLNPAGHLDGKFQNLKKIPAPQLPAGLWVGTYSVDSAGMTPAAKYPYSFIFHPDGRVVTTGFGDNGHLYISAGTYTKVDSTITATYTTLNYDRGYQVEQKATLIYHSDGTITDATWTDVLNPAGHLDGKFHGLMRLN